VVSEMHIMTTLDGRTPHSEGNPEPESVYIGDVVSVLGLVRGRLGKQLGKKSPEAGVETEIIVVEKLP